MAKRVRGSLRDPIRVQLIMERDSRQKLAGIATRMNITSSALVDLLIEHVDLTDQGVPTWAPPLERDGELPIDSP